MSREGAVFVFLFVILSSVPTLSQSRYSSISNDSLVGNVYGSVSDSVTGEPISGAVIFLLDQSIMKGSSGNVVHTNKGDFTIPDLQYTVRQGITNEHGQFLINFVPTPFPSKIYTIVVKASGYNLFIIHQVKVLPGAVMALKMECKLTRASNEAIFYEATDNKAPLKYRDEEVAPFAISKQGENFHLQKINGSIYDIFATREGLVGGTTANRHIIVPKDRFVALPSRRALNANDQTYDFKVRLTYQGRTVDVPVWDVGPWNIYDDHWNPEGLREIYSHLHHGGQLGLGEGLPEAQAAYLQGYNQGWSGDFGGNTDRQVVLNPAGIDLADGTFWDDLQMTQNDWVAVNYLWRPGVKVGDRVQTTINLNVRSTAAGLSVGVEPNSGKGTITDGPQGMSLGGTFYVWWKIQWDDALSGWSAENWLEPVISTQSQIALTVSPGSELDFGNVAVGQNKTMNIIITNTTLSTANLVVAPDIPTSPFEILNGASLNLVPGNSYNFNIKFTPTIVQAYSQNWSFSHNATNFSTPWTIVLKGNGTSSQQLNPPTLSAPTNGSTGISTSPTVIWNASSGATSYTVQVSQNSDMSNPVFNQNVGNVTSQQVSGLSYSTSYYWRVNATNSAGTSVWSSTWNFSTGAPPVVPPPTPILSSPANNSTGVSTSPTVSWNASSGATSYTLQVSQNGDMSNPVFNQNVGNVTSQQVSGLSYSTLYYWRVNATNSAGTSGWSSTWNFSTGAQPIVPPSPPTLSSPTNNLTGVSTSPTVSWNTSSGATSYTLQVSHNSDMSNPVFNQNVGNVTSQQVSGLSYSTLYYWRVNASNSNGTSGWSSTWNFTVTTSVIPLSINLSDSWNMISSNVIPSNLSITEIFKDIVSKVVIVKDEAGQVYWPRFGVNQIGNWNIVEGYMICMNSPATLTIQGQRANPSTPIPLEAVWSIIAYLPNVSLSPATALASLGDKVVIIKDEDGKVYWPRYNIDQIGTMQVGKGYLVYLSSAGTLTYPVNTSKDGNILIVENRNRRQIGSQHFSYVRRTGSNATILMRMNVKSIINGTALEVGDEIGVFTPKRICAGAGVWNGDNIVIAVWGDNGETMNIDGFTEGQSYNFKLWDKSTNLEKDISVIAESGTLSYSENGITIISYEKSTALPDNFVLRQNYPNPFNPTTRIEYQIKEQSEVTLAIYGTSGQLIRVLVKSSHNVGAYSVEWDGRNSYGIQVPNGIYLYRLQAGSVVETRKMVVMK